MKNINIFERRGVSLEAIALSETPCGLVMNFYIGTNGGSGMKFETKEAFLKEIEMMIEDCVANGGSQFDIAVDADASCFYEGTDEDDRG